MTAPDVAAPRRTRSPVVCVCGHVLSSHRPDPDDLWVEQRCKTCGCAGFENRDEAKMQGDDDDDRP